MRDRARRFAMGAVLCALWCAISASASAQTAATEAPQGAGYHQRVRDAVRDVLARREFEGIQRADEPSWWRRVVEWFDGLIEGIQSLPNWLWWVMLVWMVLTLAAILGHMIYTLVGGLIAAPGPTDRDRADPGAGEGPWLGVRELNFESAYRRAVELHRDGQWAAAIRHLYVAAILCLNDQHRLRFHRSKTNCAYLRELSGDRAAAARFGDLTGLFETTTYGRAAATEPMCRRAAQLVEQLRHAQPLATDQRR